MVFVLPKNTEIALEFKEGSLHTGPLHTDLRFEWEKMATTPEERKVGLAKFRHEECFILCDRRDVHEYTSRPRLTCGTAFWL